MTVIGEKTLETAKTETVFELVPMRSFETAPQTHLKQQKDTIQAQIPLARVFPIKASFVWATQWTVISQAGKREQYSCEEVQDRFSETAFVG